VSTHTPSSVNLPPAQSDKVWLRVVVVLVLGVGAFQYFYRGVWRAMHASGDFSGPYAASRVFWKGGNTYDTKTLKDELKSAQVPGKPRYVHVASCLYPPQTFVLYSPLGLLQWHDSRIVLALINSILPFVLVASLKWTNRQVDLRTMLFALAIVLYWAPLISGIRLGQPAVLSVSLSFLSIQCASMNRQGLAGCLLTLSVFAKVHDALPVVIYFAIRRWWRSLLILGVAGVVSTVLIGLWWGDEVPIMVRTLLENYRFEKERGLMSPSGPMNWQRIDVSCLWPGRTFELVMLCTLIVLPLTATIAWKDRKRETGGPPTVPQSMALACLSLWSLLAVYHRYYDAFVLVVPILHAIQAVPGKWELSAEKWLAILGGLPFLASLSAIIYAWFPEWRVPLHASFAGQWLMLHVNFVMLVAFLILAWKLSRSLRGTGEQH
jgi:hypothetical protein